MLAENPGSGTDPEIWIDEGKLDPRLEVFGPGGELVAENDDIDTTMTDSGGVVNTDAEVTFTVPASGTYQIVIRSSWNGLTNGDYTLVIESETVATATPTPSPPAMNDN